MHFLALQFEASPYSNDHQVRPVIDGIDLLRDCAGDSLGIDPPQFFRQSALGRKGKLLIGRCSCGDVGCGAIRVDIAVADRRVTWQFEAESTYHFELQQYLECFERASLNTAWESVGRTAERLVSSIDFGRLSDQGYRFEWASTRITRACVTLCFVKDGRQRLFGVDWDDRRAEDAEQQVRSWAAHYAERDV
jgi:hypothetical protein